MKQPLKYLCFMILIIVVSAIFTYLIHPDIQSTINSVSSKIPKSVEHKSGLDLVVAYIVNNGFKVPLQMLILGLIPIPFLYWLQPVATVLAPGIVFGIIFDTSFEKGITIVISSLPHMLVETLAFCFWIVALDRINKWMRNKISKKMNNSTRFMDEIKRLITSYFKYVLPLIVIAAFLETYVADWISNSLN
ncbi:stage II sporulation protein M [Leuconostoc sp.]|uniref:stage II sporulation protein M n=1 Tax=Leuconostoc sp. TaxID=1930076 RepID=UPI00257E6BA5|nr:stage II sporulation protein M [Leuconostoc sp.]NLT86037.1 stage II sporulation protein M [Leuconostoc sp.]